MFRVGLYARVSTHDQQTLPLQILSYIQGNDDPQIAALSTLLLVLSIIFIVAVERAGTRATTPQPDPGGHES